MFLTAVKTAMVEALEMAFDADITQVGEKPIPRRITIEYAEAEQDWPFILVQVRPTTIKWTGIVPDEYIKAEPVDEVNPWRSIRQGYFEASVMLQIMALTSGERDQIWDSVVKLLMMGRKRESSKDFFKSIEEQDLIGITVQEGTVLPIGDTVSQGTPWNPETIAYEASVQFEIVGRFYADEYDETLITLEAAAIYPYIEPPVENPPEGTGTGTWESAWIELDESDF